MGDRITVLLVDDHEMARRGLRRILELEQDIEVVAEASDAKQALLLAERLSPDVIFMDIRMNEVSGIILLASVETRTLSLLTLDFLIGAGGSKEAAAVLTIVTMFIAIGAVLIGRRFGLKLTAGQ